MSEDAEDLRRYAVDRSESAFAELVQRHVDLVYSAALRFLAGDVHRAQDVTQLVFTELCRQASRLTRHPVLTGWLYTTTRLIARHEIRAEQRRKAREEEAHLMNELSGEPEPCVDWDRLRLVLDDALQALGEKDRLPLLLRFFQNRSFKEVGVALSLSENAARMRVERALDRLRIRLARKGLTSTTAALALTLASHAVEVAPSAFVSILAGASLAGAAAGTGSAFTLLNIMAMTKLKLGLISALAVAGVGTPFWLQHQALGKLRQQNESLQQQVARLARVEAENERLAHLITEPKGSSNLANLQFSE